MRTAEQLRATSRWARVNLGLTPQEFFALTPAEWNEYMRLWCEKERREDIRAARIQCTIASCMSSKSGGYKPSDFLPPDPMAPQKEKRRKAPDLRRAFMAATAKHQHVFTNGKQ